MIRVMPQEFIIGRCFSCLKFQVLQVRKDKKFICKVCGIKQSLKKEYGRGDAKNCRVEVQNLNLAMGTADLNFFSECDIPTSTDNELKTNCANALNRESKWKEFLDSKSEIPQQGNRSSSLKRKNVGTSLDTAKIQSGSISYDVATRNAPPVCVPVEHMSGDIITEKAQSKYELENRKEMTMPSEHILDNYVTSQMTPSALVPSWKKHKDERLCMMPRPDEPRKKFCPVDQNSLKEKLDSSSPVNLHKVKAYCRYETVDDDLDFTLPL